MTQPSKIVHDTTKCKYFSDFLRDFSEKVAEQNHFKLKGKTLTKTHTKMVPHNFLVQMHVVFNIAIVPIKISLYEIMYFWLVVL